MSIMASTSTIQLHPDPKCSVFLSFHGKDTRLTFTGYLCYALDAEKIPTFIDSEYLESSREISSALIRVIEHSEIAVIIFSENYGSSSWCLDELLHIIRRKDDNGLVVIPIFYHIDPSTVRWQNGTFGDGFVKLRKYHNDDKMDAWRKVLKNAADISGFHRTQSYSSEPEPILIKKIVEDISKKLARTSFYNCNIAKGLIGIDTRFEKLKSLISIHSTDILFIGVWGMGGIGKTTLTRVLYYRLKSQFEVHCFLENVRETLQKQGKDYLKKQFYSQLFKENYPKIEPERLSKYKALIVLDDVDDIQQMMGLVEHGLVGSGSRIIVTSRDEAVLGKADHIYTFIPLDLDESYQLFLLHAFKGDKPSKEYEVVLDKVVNYAKGIPLALVILGSYFNSISKKYWDSAWKKLEGYSYNKIDAVLRISYDGLDRFEKDIFLDIACFFIGENKDSVQEILDACDLYANLGINVMKKRCLIYIDEDDNLRMHDLVCGMAHKIAIEENEKKHGKGKRIFKMDDLQNVLQYNKGAKGATITIRGIILNYCQSKKLVLRSTCFSNMCDLKFLKIYDSIYRPHYIKLPQYNYKVHAPEGLITLPNDLIYLHWVGYNSKYIPSFNPKNLVELIMPYSLLERLWKEIQFLVNLRKIDLSYSTKLIEVSSISEAKNLKVVNLQGCERLRELPLSFKKMCKLTSLNINGCNKLWSGNINPVEPLKNFKYLTNLRELKMRNTSIEIVPSSIECLSRLVELDLSNCSRLKSLPSSICTMKSLEKLSAVFCERLEIFPEILKRPSRLKRLCLDCSGIKNLPTSMHRLTSLQELSLYWCTKLEKFQILKPMESLTSLSLSGTGITELCLSPFNSLRTLSVSHCLNLEKLQSLPIDFGVLVVVGCNALRFISELPSNLDHLRVCSCSSLETISSSMTTNDTKILRKKTFLVENCPKLVHCNLWDEARAKTLRQAILSRKNIPKERDYEPLSADVEIRWTGNEMPVWMTYRNKEGSSINIDLPPKWCDPNFLGFALCIVLGGNGDCNKCVHCKEYIQFCVHRRREYIRCKAVFKSGSGKSMEVSASGRLPYVIDRLIYNSDSVFFFYSVNLNLHSKDTGIVANGDCKTFHVYNQVTFEFTHENTKERALIKKCGVHMLSSHEAEKCGLMISGDTSKPTTSARDAAKISKTTMMKLSKRRREKQPRRSRSQ